MERKVGEIFGYNGEWYQCMEGTECCRCAFYDKICIADNLHYICRSDKKNVIFKKLEKVGEPHFIYDKIFKGGKVYVQNFMVYEDFKNHKPICDDYVLYDWHEKIISIEIKQNKEDMKERKLNLRPFDLEAAKAGKPVYTRDGRKVRIICFDAKCNKPIVALIQGSDNSEQIEYYTENGVFSNNGITGKNRDLMMLLQKKEGWIIIHKEAIYDKETAEKIAKETTADVIRIQKIEWEE